jgi:hypothetical protein
MENQVYQAYFPDMLMLLSHFTNQYHHIKNTLTAMSSSQQHDKKSILTTLIARLMTHDVLGMVW